MIIIILLAVLISLVSFFIPSSPLNIHPEGIISQPIEPLQLSSMIVILGILFLLYLEYREDKDNWRWLFPMAIWMIFGLSFYILLFLERYFNIEVIISYTNLSGILRWYGYITLFLIEYFRLIWHRIKKGKTPDPVYDFFKRIFNRRLE